MLDQLEMDQRRSATAKAYTKRQGCRHMVFLGGPGTGKTAVAHLVAVLLKRMGLLRRGQLIVGKKADLLGQYSNHVAKNTRGIIRQALGGVLLIDEAYSLLQGEAELGRECINVLVDMAYEHRDDLVIILAGYPESTSALFHANAGLASRFPHRFFFPDYDLAQLTSIARLLIEDASFTVAAEGGAAALQELLAPIRSESPSGNARSVENRVTTAISAQSSRLAARRGPGEALSEAQLFELTAEDFEAAGLLMGKAADVLASALSREAEPPPAEAEGVTAVKNPHAETERQPRSM